MSFLKSGYKQSLKSQKVKTKKHIKAFYKILESLDVIARAIDNKYRKDLIENLITEDTIVEYAKEFTDMKLERMETNILLAKLDIIRESHVEDKS